MIVLTVTHVDSTISLNERKVITMPFGYYGFYYDDPIVILMLVAAMLFAFWAQAKVKSTFNKYSKEKNTRGMTGADAARQVLQLNDVSGVKIERVSGKLSDHFDPRGNVIRLSDDVYGSTSVAALGVAAHEAGHAVQYAKGYFPMKIRSAIIPMTNIGSNLSMPLILLGFVFNFEALVSVGIILFSFAALFQLVTLPVEFDASRRAMKALDTGDILYGDELKGARKTLSAAAMTYVAALAVAVVNLIRIIARYGNRRD